MMEWWLAMKELLIGYLFKDKKKTIFYITIISIAIAIFLSSTGFIQGLKSNRLELSENKNGSYHIELKNLHTEQVNKLKNNTEIRNLYKEYILGEFYADYDSLILYRETGYSNVEKHLNILLEGKYPKKINEVLINKSYIKKLNKNIGDTFDVDYYVYNDNNHTMKEENSKFKISGIIDDFSADSNMNFILVSENYGKIHINDLKVNSALIILKDYKYYQNFIYDIQKNFNIYKDVYINNELINNLYEDEQLNNYNIIINIAILFIFFIILYITLFGYLDNILEDIKSILAIGFTKKYIAKLVISIIFIFLFISIIPGYIIYYLIALLFKLLGFNFIQKGNILNQLFSILLFEFLLVVPAIIMYLIEILKMDIFEIKKATRKKSMIVNKLNKIFINRIRGFGIKEYTRSNLIRNYKKNVAIVIITVLSFGFLSYVANIYNLFVKEDYSWYHYYIPNDIVLETQNLNIVNYDDENKNIQYFTKDVAGKIRSLKSVKNIQEHLIIEDTILLHMDNGVQEFIEKNNDEIYTTNIIKINKSKYLGLSAIMFGYDFYFKNNNVDNPIILTTYIKDKFGLKKGDSILISDNKNKNISFTIVDFLDKIPIHLSYETTTSCIVRNEDLAKITGIDGYNRFDITMSNKNDFMIEQELNKIGNISKIGNIRVFNKEIEGLKEESNKELKAQLIVIFAMILITILTVGNIINENITERKKEIELLYSLGITKKEINNSIIKENMYVGIFSSVFVFVIQIILFMISINMKGINMKILCGIVIIIMELSIFYIFTKYTIKRITKD